MTINKHDALLGTFGLLCVASAISSVALLSNGLLTNDETTREQSYKASTGLCFVALLAGTAFVCRNRHRVVVASKINTHSAPQIRLYELNIIKKERDEESSKKHRRLTMLPSQKAPDFAIDMPLLELPAAVSNSSPHMRRANFNR